LELLGLASAERKRRPLAPIPLRVTQNTEAPAERRCFMPFKSNQKFFRSMPEAILAATAGTVSATAEEPAPKADPGLSKLLHPTSPVQQNCQIAAWGR
jgi:hypothetical protein